jgi:hypothetical protein
MAEPGMRYGSTAFASSVTIGARENDVAAMGATLVNFHSSSRLVGNPRSTNR